MPHPGDFVPGKQTQDPFNMGLGEPQDWSGWVQKILPLVIFDPRTIQPIASHSTDNTILCTWTSKYDKLKNAALEHKWNENEAHALWWYVMTMYLQKQSARMPTIFSTVLPKFIIKQEKQWLHEAYGLLGYETSAMRNWIQTFWVHALPKTSRVQILTTEDI
jgi:hypothetical protein